MFSVRAVDLFGLWMFPKRLRFQCLVLSIGAPGLDLPTNQTDATSSTDPPSLTTKFLAFLADERGVGSGRQIPNPRMQANVDIPSRPYSTFDIHFDRKPSGTCVSTAW